MTTVTTKVSAKVLAGATALAMATSMLSFAPIAQAQAMTTTTTTTCSVGTSDLTIGSTGVAVSCLQQALIAAGFSIPAGATGYFGTQTRAAVASWQSSKNIAPAVGYFGPISRAAFGGSSGTTTTTTTVPGCTAGAAFSSTTGAACTSSTTVPGCTAGAAFSSTTGKACGSTTTTTTTTLSGGAGSVDTYTLISSFNNEKVGEDEEDVEVAGLEIEADSGSDLDLTAVRLVFDEGTANENFDEYASEVSVWFDGKEVARIDADEFNDDNAWTKTISLDGAVLEAGEKGELTVAVSGNSTIDSGNAAETWTVDFRQIRFVDADGSTVSEDPTTGTRTFSFETFATASNVEFKIQSDDADVNDSRVIEVSTSNDTDNVEVLSFTMEAEGDSDLDIKTFGVSVTVTGATNTDDVINNLTLWIDGEEVASANTVSSGGATEAYTFADVDYVIDAGDTVDAVIKADFNDIETTAFDEGDTIAVALGEEQTDTSAIFDIEDESSENLADADKTGSVTSGAFELRSTGIMVTFVSASESVQVDDGVDDDTGTFVIKYNVEAFGGTVYVSDSAAATTDVGEAGVEETELPFASGVVFVLESDGVATTVKVSDITTFRDVTGDPTDASITNGVELNEGEVAEFTLTVTRTNDTATDDNGIFRVLLDAIAWATTDTTPMNVYDFNLEDFKTDPVTLD